ncbi:hypothetical protein MKK69_01000, partial [Methylobacterium sp. J-026]|uniref:hypothetical protein n=1 Tax=Methylobacterium sp. J-026 TaxID=2836624 RepID=UPI001FB96ED3
HQEDHAELGEMRDLRAVADGEEVHVGMIVGEAPEAVGSQQGAGADEACPSGTRWSWRRSRGWHLQLPARLRG